MFKFLIEGKTIKELKANVDEFFREFEVLQPSNKVNPSQDISAHFAAKLQELPKDIAPELARSIPTIVSTAVNPIAPVGTAVSNDYGVDSRGLPWDERIHSVTQAKVKDGSWRYRRGAEESQIKTVEAELASKMQGVQASQMEAPSPQIPVVSNVPTVPANPAVPVAPSMNHLNVPTPVAAPIAPPPPPQSVVPSAHTLATFKATLVPTLAKLVREGKLDQPYINSLCEHYKVEMLFKVNDEQLAEVFEGFVQYGLIVKAE